MPAFGCFVGIGRRISLSSQGFVAADSWLPIRRLVVAQSPSTDCYVFLQDEGLQEFAVARGHRIASTSGAAWGWLGNILGMPKWLCILRVPAWHKTTSLTEILPASPSATGFAHLNSSYPLPPSAASTSLDRPATGRCLRRPQQSQLQNDSASTRSFW